jgi:uncharacterized protein (DUF305 family)
MKKLYASALAASAIATALVISGCTASDDSPNPTTSAPAAEVATFNRADAMFTAMMIPHHEQAIEMADIVLAKDGVDPRVAELATAIKAAQGPEIELMEDWLDEWGVDANSQHMDDMDHGDGMMSMGDLDDLEAAEGAEASSLFLEQMVVHHEGAIEMAQAEIEAGENSATIALAQKILEDQTAEIVTMQELLADL